MKTKIGEVMRYLAVVFSIAAFVLTGCGGGGGGGVAELPGGGEPPPPAGTSVSISGKVDPGILGASTASLRKALQASATTLGTVSAINIADLKELGKGDINGDGSFSVSFIAPSTKFTVVFKADVTGKGTYRAVYPMDLSNPPTGSTSNTVSVTISSATNTVVTKVSPLLGLSSGKLLGDEACTKDFDTVVRTVVANGGQYITYGAAGINLIGTLDPGLFPTMTVSAKASPRDGHMVGFDTPVTIAASVSNAPSGTTPTYTFTLKEGPAVTISASGSSASFTTKSAADSLKHLAEEKLEDNKTSVLKVHNRAGLVGINDFQLEMMSYTIEVKAVAGSQTATTNIIVEPTNRQAGINNIPVGTIVLVNTKSAAGYNWTMTPAAGSTATFKNATTRNPWFIADKVGTYALSDGNGKSVTVYAGTFVGVGLLTTNASISGSPKAIVALTDVQNCYICHNPTSGPNRTSVVYGYDIGGVFGKWVNTGHSRILSWNIDGAGNPATSHYSESCFKCHSVGYMQCSYASNYGFKEVATSLSWTFPAITSSNWSTLMSKYPKLAGLSNIQCESCHGPNGGDPAAGPTAAIFGPAHTKGITSRASLDAELCGFCHGEPPRHNRYQLWQQGGHANYELAESRGTSSSCGRCHSAQGFIAWLRQINETGNTGSLTGAYLTEYQAKGGADPDRVAPQTCAACHDKHDTGLTGTASKQRKSGTVGMLPAGFSYGDAGTGAICMMCHNSRNGLRDDANPTTTSYSAPHVAAQSDVFAGRNAYFVSVPQISNHALIKNTCAGCHMEAIPATIYGSGANHTFKGSTTICNKCHGASGATLVSVDATAFQSEITAQMEELEHKIGDAAKTKINAAGTIKVRAFDANTDLYSSTSATNANVTIAVSANPVHHVELTEGHGQMEFHITLTNPITITWTNGSQTTTKEFGVQVTSLYDNAGTRLYAANSNVAKASWNYLLLHGDDTKGIHNPSFVKNVLTASKAANLTQ